MGDVSRRKNAHAKVESKSPELRFFMIYRRKGGGLRPEGQIRQGKAKKRNLGEQSTERLDRLTLNEERPVETYLLSVGKGYDQHTPS